jgi:hypothetical protein
VARRGEPAWVDPKYAWLVREPRLPWRRLVDVAVTLAVAVGVAYALGALFVWLWAPPPTPENSSPPPEAFLFFYGALIGFVVVVLVRVFLVSLWLQLRCASRTGES